MKCKRCGKETFLPCGLCTICYHKRYRVVIELYNKQTGQVHYTYPGTDGLEANRKLMELGSDKFALREKETAT